MAKKNPERMSCFSSSFNKKQVVRRISEPSIVVSLATWKIGSMWLVSGF